MNSATELDLCPAPSELPNNYLINGYKLLRPIGQGGFGITYLAIDELLDRPVVIKEQFPQHYCYRSAGTLDVCPLPEVDPAEYRSAMSNFLREMRLLAKLDHPHIVRTFTYFEAHQTAYYVTEHIDGAGLADVAADYRKHLNHIPQQPLYALMVRVLDALDYLHSRNILHLDIKPDNILVTRNGSPILIDFGAALDLNERGSGTVIETPGYSPPEQGTPSAKLTPAADLYAFAATLYYCLTGLALPSGRQRLLFDQLKPLSSMRELTNYYHPRLLTTIDKALTPGIENRYPTAADWLRDLRPDC